MSWECPHCHTNQCFSQIPQQVIWFIGKCNLCKNLSLVEFKKNFVKTHLPPPFRKLIQIKPKLNGFEKPKFLQKPKILEPRKLPDPLPNLTTTKFVKDRSVQALKISLFFIIFGAYFYSTQEGRSQSEKKIDFSPVNNQKQYTKFPSGKLYSLNPPMEGKTTSDSKSNLKVQIIKNDCWVRSGPGREFPVISKVQSGEEYAFVRSENLWTQIDAKDGQGWIFSESVKILNH